MAITETHVVSGVITLGSGVTVVASGLNVNVGNFPSTSISGNVVNISGQSVSTSISGNVVNISGQSVQTSISGNVVMTLPFGSNTPTVYAGGISGITWQSGGTQLPNVPCGISLSIDTIYISGNVGVGSWYAGGVGNNAPYFDSSAFPNHNGIHNTVPVGITNLNQVSVVHTTSGFFGVLVYTAVG